MPTVRSRIAIASIALLALIPAACGQSAAPSPTTAPATAAPTAAGPAELCATTPGTGCTFFAGDFKSTHFGGGVTFHLIGEDWTNTANEADVIVLLVGDAVGGGFGGGSNPDNSLVFVHGAPKIQQGAAFTAVSDPDGAKAALGAIAGLTVTPAAGQTIDGQVGTVFRVANSSAAPITLWQYPTTTGAGTYDLAEGSTTEVHWLDMGGVPVIVAILAPTTNVDGAVLGLDDTLKSIVFE